MEVFYIEKGKERWWIWGRRVLINREGKLGLGNISITYQYCDMIPDFVVDVGYRNFAQVSSFPGFKGFNTLK